MLQHILILVSSRSSSFFSLCSLNTGLCEHAISWQGPISVLAVPFGSKLLTLVYAGYELGTAANLLWGHFSIITQCLGYYLSSVVFQLFSASKKTGWCSYFINEIWACSVANSRLVIFFISFPGWGNARIYSGKAPQGSSGPSLLRGCSTEEWCGHRWGAC